MNTSSTTTQSHPVLPSLFSLPLKMIPSYVHDKALTASLNKVFHNELMNGELDFLQDRIVHITIEDAGVEYRFTLNKNKLVPGNKKKTADVSLKGTLYNYLCLASRREDTDALFFSRRLQMQGDTELGLYVKNFLDGMDMDSHKFPAYIESALQKILPVYEKLFG